MRHYSLLSIFLIALTVSPVAQLCASPENSIADYLQSQGRPHDFKSRVLLWDETFPLEKGHYKGKADQNIRLLYAVRAQDLWSVTLEPKTAWRDGDRVHLKITGLSKLLLESDLSQASSVLSVRQGQIDAGPLSAGFHRLAIKADGFTWSGMLIALPGDDTKSLTVQLIGAGQPGFEVLAPTQSYLDQVGLKEAPKADEADAAFTNFAQHMSSERFKAAISHVVGPWLKENAVGLTKTGTACLLLVPTGVGSGACFTSVSMHVVDLTADTLVQMAATMRDDGLISASEFKTLKLVFISLNAGAQFVAPTTSGFNKVSERINALLSATDALSATIENEKVRFFVKMSVQSGQKILVLVNAKNK